MYDAEEDYAYDDARYAENGHNGIREESGDEALWSEQSAHDEEGPSRVNGIGNLKDAGHSTVLIRVRGYPGQITLCL